MRRTVAVALAACVAGVLVLLLARGASAAPSAPAAPGCTHVWDSASPKCLVRRAGGAIASGIAGKIVDAVSWLAKQIGDGARTAGRPDVSQGWFDWAMFNTRQLGVLFAVVGMLLSICYAALKRDLGEIGRTLARVLAAGLTTGGITMVVAAANNLVDNLCDYVLGRQGWAVVTNAVKLPVQQLARTAGTDPSSPGQTTPQLIVVLIGVLMLFALAMIWVELLIRRIVIDVCVLFWPLAVSGAVWTNARLWTRRLVDTIAGFVLSKLLIIIMLRFAADALTDMNSVSDLLVAVGVFTLAALMPFWVMRVIGFFGGAVHPGHTGEGLRAAAVGATVAVGMSVSRAATSVAGAGATGDAGTAVGIAGVSKAGTGVLEGRVLGGGRTPMPPIKQPDRGNLGGQVNLGGQGNQGGRPGAPDGPGRTGFTPGGRPAFTPRGAPQKGTDQGAEPASSPNSDGEQPPWPPGTQPPSPRRYPRTPVPPHVRPASSDSGSRDSGSGGRTDPGRGTPGTPGASSGAGAVPRPPMRPRPVPWPQPRRGDPSEPMLRPPPPTPPTPPPPASSEDG